VTIEQKVTISQRPSQSREARHTMARFLPKNSYGQQETRP